MTEPIRKEVSEEIRIWAEADSRMRYKMEVEMEKAAEREEGREEGRKEAFVEIARALKAKGLEPAFIAETTGLTTEEIEKL